MKKIALLFSAAFAVTLMLSGIAACDQKNTSTPAETSASPGEAKFYGFDEGMAKAKADNKYVMVDFHTSWCKYCKMLDSNTFTDAGVINRLNNDFVAIKVDAEGDGKLTYDGKQITENQLASSLKVTGYPTIWFFKPDGEKLKYLPGYSPAKDFVHILDYVSSGGMERNEDYSKFLEKQGISPE